MFSSDFSSNYTTSQVQPEWVSSSTNTSANGLQQRLSSVKFWSRIQCKYAFYRNI